MAQTACWSRGLADSPHPPEALAQPPGGSAGSAEQMYSFQVAALRWFGVEKAGQEVGGAGLSIVEETEAQRETSLGLHGRWAVSQATRLFLSLFLSLGTHP